MTTLSPSGMSPPGSKISEDDIKAKLSEFSESTELPIPVVPESWKVSYGYDYDGDASVYVSATVEDDDIEDGEAKYSDRNKLHSMIYKLVSRIIGHLEKRQGKGSRRKSCYRDRRVERAWNAHVPHRAAASTSSDTAQSLDHPPRRTTALWLRQRPGRSCSNYHPAI